MSQYRLQAEVTPLVGDAPYYLAARFHGFETEPTAGAEMTQKFEESLAALEKIVAALEEGRGLSESLELYEHGVKHLKHCHAALHPAEQKLQMLVAVDEDGNPVVQPFKDHNSDDLQNKAAARQRRRSANPDTQTTSEDEIDEDAGLF